MMVANNHDRQLSGGDIDLLAEAASRESSIAHEVGKEESPSSGTHRATDAAPDDNQAEAGKTGDQESQEVAGEQQPTAKPTDNQPAESQPAESQRVEPQPTKEEPIGAANQNQDERLSIKSQEPSAKSVPLSPAMVTLVQTARLRKHLCGVEVQMDRFYAMPVACT